MNMNFSRRNSKRKRICIVDVDGTLIDSSERFKIATKKGKIDWNIALDEKYLRMLDRPMPRHVIDKIVRICNEKCDDIIVLTGRPERLRGVTLEQLRKINFTFSKLVMRKDSDYSKEIDFKISKILEISRYGNIVAMFDDNTELLNAIKSLFGNVKIYHVTRDDVYELTTIYTWNND